MSREDSDGCCNTILATEFLMRYVIVSCRCRPIIRCDLHVVGHDVVLFEVNWCRFVTLLLARLMGQYGFAR